MSEAKTAGMRPPQLMPIPKSWFPRIEQALGIQLTPQQKFKLFYPRSPMTGMRNGKTLVHCILVALSIGPPLSIESASDYGNGTMHYKYSYFMPLYARISAQLEGAGFDVRQVGAIGGWKVLK